MKTYKVMLLPTRVQNTRLFQFAGASRYAYNWAIDCQKSLYELTGKSFSESELRKQFTQHKREFANKWTYTISNDVFKQAIRDCFQAYKRFFQHKSKYPRYKSKKRGHYSFYQDTSKIQISPTQVRIELLSPKKNRKHLFWIKLAEPNRIPIGSKYANPRITFDGLHWWISISVEVTERQAIIEEYTEPIGIDLGVKELAICSNGTVFPNVNKTTKIRILVKRKKRYQRQLSKKYKMNTSGTKTRNTLKQEKRLIKIYHRIANINKSYRLGVIQQIIQRKPSCIVLENLNISGMMKNRHLARAIQEQGLYQFRITLEYYAHKFGICIKYADRFYPSSKMCSCCGAIKTNLKLSERTYHCEHCGVTIDRDINAAKNLAALVEYPDDTGEFKTVEQYINTGRFVESGCKEAGRNHKDF